jgi:allantoate deiminase
MKVESNPRRDGAYGATRIREMLEQLSHISADGPGVTRLAYTEREREAHAFFTAEMEALGVAVKVDPAGNTIAEKPGSVAGLPALGTGSHLDSVPNGGRFDGIAGVVSAIFAAELLVREATPHRHPIRFVAFAAEEGARFGQACIGSGLAAGLMSEADLRSKLDQNGVSVAQAMSEVGLDPSRAASTPWNPSDWAAFVELHVEQGAELERLELPLGLVDLISGSTRLALQLDGQASHTGATPMDNRMDALAAAAEVVLAGESLATDAQHRGTRVTVGKLDVYPGSITTIPGAVRMSVDIRDVDSDRQRTTAGQLLRRARAICDKRGVGLQVEVLGDASPVVLPAWLRDVVAGAAHEVGISYRTLTSGASHDTQMINQVIPGAMLFVPSRAGLSHVPEEWTSPDDICVGSQVLLAALMRLDSVLTDGVSTSEVA